MMSAPGPIQRPRLPDGTPVDNMWVWLIATLSIATLPLIFLLDMREYIEATVSQNFGLMMEASINIMMMSLVISAISMVFYGVNVFFAYRDYAHLVSLGVVRPFHWAFIFLGALVYLIGRHVVLRKVVRTPGWPMWVCAIVNVIAVIVALIWTFWIMQIAISSVI